MLGGIVICQPADEAVTKTEEADGNRGHPVVQEEEANGQIPKVKGYAFVHFEDFWNDLPSRQPDFFVDFIVDTEFEVYGQKIWTSERLKLLKNYHGTG